MKGKILDQRFTVNRVYKTVICENWSRRKIKEWFDGRKYATFAELIDANLSSTNYSWAATHLNFTSWQNRKDNGMPEMESRHSVSTLRYLSLFDCIIAYGLDNAYL